MRPQECVAKDFAGGRASAPPDDGEDYGAAGASGRRPRQRTSKTRITGALEGGLRQGKSLNQGFTKKVKDSGRWGQLEALCVSVSLLPSSPPHPLSACGAQKACDLRSYNTMKAVTLFLSSLDSPRANANYVKMI